MARHWATRSQQWLQQRLNRKKQKIDREQVVSIMNRLNVMHENLRVSRDSNDMMLAYQEQLSSLEAKVKEHEDNLVKNTDIETLKKRLSLLVKSQLVELEERLSSLKQRMQLNFMTKQAQERPIKIGCDNGCRP